MSAFEQGEVRADVVQDLRAQAERGADVTELVECLVGRLGLTDENALFPVLVYFRSAFCLSLREVLPLREWLDGKDRSEIDSILIPAIQRNGPHWLSRQRQNV
jgi:hypothetical protein